MVAHPEPYIGTPESETQENIAIAKSMLRDRDTSISWGLPGVDKKIGSPRAGQFVVIGARPGNGKTTFCLNLAMKLHNRQITPHEYGLYRTCYMGTEMEPPELMLKWCALYLNYDEDLVLSNKWHLLPEKARENTELALHCLDMERDHTWMPSCMHPVIDDVLRNIEKAVEWGAHVIIFDHLHRLKPRHGQTERDALVEATISLKTAAQQHNVLVIAASQLRREEHGVFEQYRPPHLGSFSGSMSIEGDADIAIGLYRPLKKMTVKQERAIRNGDLPLDSFIRENVMAFKCVKHRFRGAVANTTALLTVNGGRIDDYVEDPWEEINNEDKPLRSEETRTLRDLQEETRLLEESGDKGGDDADLSQMSFGLRADRRF